MISEMADAWEQEIIATPHAPPPPGARPRKSCLKTINESGPTCSALDKVEKITSSKQISFAKSGTRCLVTNTVYQERPQDGKSWRQQQAAKMSGSILRQALSGASEFRPHLKMDCWAERGWESAGLGEDTPMGGMSPEMDIEAARWRVLQMEFDQTLEEHQEVAEQNRSKMERELKKMYGVNDKNIGTRDFVSYRLDQMKA